MEPGHPGLRHQGLAQLRGRTGPLGERHRLRGERSRLLDPPGAVRRIGEQGRRTRVVGPTGTFDVRRRVVPPTRVDGRPGQSERQLGVPVAGGAIQRGTSDRERVGRAAGGQQVEHPLAVDLGRRCSGCLGAVEELGGGAQGTAGQVPMGHAQQESRRLGAGPRVGEERGRRDVVVRPTAGQQGVGCPSGVDRALRWQHGRQHRLPGERVPPPQREVLGDEQVRRVGSAKCSEDIVLGHAGHLAQQRPVRRDAQHGRRRHHPPMRLGQRPEPGLDESGERRRHRSRRSLRRQLLDEQRKPLGAPGQPAQRGLVKRTVDSRRQLGRGIIEEPAECQGQHPGREGQRGRRVRARLVVPRRDDHEHRETAHRRGQVQDHRVGVGVRPLEVLEHEQARPLPADLGQEPGHRLAQDQRRVRVRLLRLVARLAPVGEHPGQRCAVGAEGLRRYGGPAAEQPDQRLGHRAVGAAARDRRDRSAPRALGADRSASSSISRVLPMPASPRTRTSRPWPRLAALMASVSVASSPARPTRASATGPTPSRRA